MLQLQFPNIDPVFFKIGPIHLRWYGLMYLVGFVGGWFALRHRVRRLALAWTDTLMETLASAMMLSDETMHTPPAAVMSLVSPTLIWTEFGAAFTATLSAAPDDPFDEPGQ